MDDSPSRPPPHHLVPCVFHRHAARELRRHNLGDIQHDPCVYSVRITCLFRRCALAVLFFDPVVGFCSFSAKPNVAGLWIPGVRSFFYC
jgi:hypothetical protein